MVEHGSESVSLELDETYMRRALALAERGWGQTAPNPMVGAVVVRDGEVVGEGYHAQYGTAHAEPNALAAAGDKAVGATLYVSLEPCNHHGSTPPCTEAILRAGIKRVVCGTDDPNPTAGGGAERLRSAGIEVVNGVCERAARELNAPFLRRFSAGIPWVVLKLGLSLDGAIADASRRSSWITNELSRAEVQRMRANSDAIGVGVGTAIADNPSLMARTDPPPRLPPLRVVFDRNKRLPSDRTIALNSELLAPTLVLHEPDLKTALISLKRDHRVNSILVEGGAGIAAELLHHDLVDRLVIFQAPVILGRGSLNAFGCVDAVDVAQAVRFPIVKRQEFGSDLMTIYAVHDV